MSIEIITTKAINLPVDDISKHNDNEINRDDVSFLNNLSPIENQILSYKPEQFQNQGNSISAQIVESIARLDSSIQNMNKEIESSRNSTQLYKPTQTESPHKSNSQFSNDHLSDRSILRDSYWEHSDKLFQRLRTVQKTALTIKFVSALSNAFSKTLNKFLRM
jgi:hypothetical protein